MPAALKTTWRCPTTPWTSALRRRARAGRDDDSAGPPLPARRGGALRRLYRRQLQAVEDRGGDRCQIHRVLRRALYGGERGCAGPRGPAGDSARSERRLLDGRYGGDLAGGRLLGSAGAAGAGGGYDSADLHQFDGGDQGILRRARRAGVHLVQLPCGVGVGICARQADSVSA